MMNTNENYFKTSDLTLATTISLFYPIITTDRTNSPKVMFVFNRSTNLNKLIDKYWRGEINVEPQKFANQIKNLKTRIYSGE